MSEAVRIIKRGKPASTLTKAETVALWHAVDWMDLCLRQPPSADDRPEAVAAEKETLTTAKRALRKVNALRRQGL